MLLPHLSLFSAVSIRQGVLVTGRKRLLLHVHCCALLYFRCSVLRICVSILPRLATVNHPSLPLKWWHKQVNRVKEQISPSPLISPHQWSTTSLLITHPSGTTFHIHTRSTTHTHILYAFYQYPSRSDQIAFKQLCGTCDGSQESGPSLIRCCTCWPRICMSSTYEWFFLPLFDASFQIAWRWNSNKHQNDLTHVSIFHLPFQWSYHLSYHHSSDEGFHLDLDTSLRI